MTLAGQVGATASALRGAAPQRAGIAVRAMVCVALPLAIGIAVGHPQSGASASFGGLASLYVPQSPYPYRARVVAAVGAGLAIAVLMGALAGSWTPVAAAVAGLAAGIASFVCQAAELPPPREVMLIMALLAATAVPAGWAGAAQRAGLAAAGAAAPGPGHRRPRSDSHGDGRPAQRKAARRKAAQRKAARRHGPARAFGHRAFGRPDRDSGRAWGRRRPGAWAWACLLDRPHGGRGAAGQQHHDHPATDGPSPRRDGHRSGAGVRRPRLAPADLARGDRGRFSSRVSSSW